MMFSQQQTEGRFQEATLQWNQNQTGPKISSFKMGALSITGKKTLSIIKGHLGKKRTMSRSGIAWGLLIKLNRDQ